MEIRFLSMLIQILTKWQSKNSSQICLVFIELLSKSCAILGSNVFIINQISFCFTWNEVILKTGFVSKWGQ